MFKKPQNKIASIPTNRKSQIIYKTIIFLEPIKKLRLQGNQVNGIPKDDKPFEAVGYTKTDSPLAEWER